MQPQGRVLRTTYETLGRPLPATSGNVTVRWDLFLQLRGLRRKGPEQSQWQEQHSCPISDPGSALGVRLRTRRKLQNPSFIPPPIFTFRGRILREPADTKDVDAHLHANTGRPGLPGHHTLDPKVTPGSFQLHPSLNLPRPQQHPGLDN